jgi:hypothetical protein
MKPRLLVLLVFLGLIGPAVQGAEFPVSEPIHLQCEYSVELRPHQTAETSL